jgi:hypothetical protein
MLDNMMGLLTAIEQDVVKWQWPVGVFKGAGGGRSGSILSAGRQLESYRAKEDGYAYIACSGSG